MGAPFAAPLLVRAPHGQTALQLVSAPEQSFISFQSAAAGEEGLELGAIGKYTSRPQALPGFHEQF